MSVETKLDIRDLKSLIRDVPDFPKPGIIFKDITPLLKNPAALRSACLHLADRFSGLSIDQVVAIESRGFIFGTAIAMQLQAGVVPVRKSGKLPAKTEAISYSLEYGEDHLEIHSDAIQPGTKVIIIDDLLATGGTCQAVVQLVEKLGGTVLGLGFLIELLFLKGRERLQGQCVQSLISF